MFAVCQNCAIWLFIPAHFSTQIGDTCHGTNGSGLIEKQSQPDRSAVLAWSKLWHPIGSWHTPKRWCCTHGSWDDWVNSTWLQGGIHDVYSHWEFNDYTHIFPTGACYTKHDSVTMVTLWMTLLMNKWTNIVMDDKWVQMLAKTLRSLVINLWWNIVLDFWNLDKNHFSEWHFLLQYKSIIPTLFFLPRMTNNVGLTSSVGDTIQCFTISIEQGNQNWWH